MLRRSETLFVHQVNTDRRKRLVQTMYSKFDQVDRAVHPLRIAAAAAVLIGACGMWADDLDWGYWCGWTHTMWAGVVIWALCGAVNALRTFGFFTAASTNSAEDSARPLSPVTYSLHAAAALTCRLGGACLIAIAVTSSVGHWKYVEPKTDAIISTVCVGGLLFNALMLQISFKSFAGLYAPIWPHRLAPTILPLLALSATAAAAGCASAGVQFQPQSLVSLRLSNGLRCAAWACWLAEAVGTHNTCIVVQQRLKDPVLQQERTPLTGNSTPQIVKINDTTSEESGCSR